MDCYRCCSKVNDGDALVLSQDISETIDFRDFGFASPTGELRAFVQNLAHRRYAFQPKIS